MVTKARPKRKVSGSETPEGFARAASEFYQAANLVLNSSTGVSFAAYFLLGRSAELLLKAFLMRKAVSIDVLSRVPYGHDLVGLLGFAGSHGLQELVSISDQESSILGLLSGDYTDKRFEYPVDGATYYLPLIEQTDEVVKKLLLAISPIAWPLRGPASPR